MEDEATEPPNFSHAPMNRTVREGDSATFDCRVTSYSRPHIKWLKKVEAMDTGFNLSEVILVGASRQPIILIIAIIIMIIMIITMIIMIITIIITMIIMIITGDPCGCGQVPPDPQQQGDPHHLGGRDSKSAAVKVPFLIIKKQTRTTDCIHYPLIPPFCNKNLPKYQGISEELIHFKDDQES